MSDVFLAIKTFYFSQGCFTYCWLCLYSAIDYTTSYMYM